MIFIGMFLKRLMNSFHLFRNFIKVIFQMMSAEIGPELPDIFDVLDYLEDRPVMLNALWEYLYDTAWMEVYLYSRLTEAERRLEEMEGRNARDGEPASQRSEINEEEAEGAPLPIDVDEAEDWPTEAELTPLPEDSWPAEAEWAPLPEDNEDDSEMPVAPVEESSAEVVEPAVTVRELVLRSRTISIPVPVVQPAPAAAVPEDFQPADVGNLPRQFRRKLAPPQADAYTVACIEGIPTIVCGICGRQFETIKGWRIHSSRMHKQDGFCSNCGHNLLLPSSFTAAQKCAAVELHVLEWCPRTRAAVMNERRVKRRRLDLVGREEDAQNLFVPD
uniref:C2H2-type domain-containing protein n=2 Tax=Onchocerca volvulus TaxID=6282 RepID=A0A8R1XPE2_ONCVO